MTPRFIVHSPKTKLSGLNSCPNGPERTESMVPGSRSTRMARGTNLLPVDEKRAKDRGIERGKGWKGGVGYRQSRWCMMSAHL